MRSHKQKRVKKPRKGLGSSLATRVQRNPALAGGATALLVVMGMVTLNAVWFQAGKHPSPIFTTRTDADLVLRTGSIKIKPKHSSLNVPNENYATAQPNELTKEVQAALAIKGLYEGKIDGLFDSKTQSAISEYQKQAGTVVSGKVSAKLLSQILLSGKAAARIPVPKSQIALEGTKPKHDDEAHRLVSTIQSGLKNYGYEDIVVDGVMGSQTSYAIRRFELDYGLRITGEASMSILKKLTDIGVINQG